MDPEPAPRRPPTPWITIALVAANVIVFAWELASGAGAMSSAPQKLFELGGNLPSATLGGQWWRLGSAMFMHAGLLHIGMNMLCLWQARIVEVAFGRAAFAAIYVVAGLLGGIATALHGGNVVSVGASGAVFGVYGAFFAFLLVRRDAFPRDVWDKVARQMAPFLGINLALGFSVKGIDMSAHLGGLAAGALGGAALVLETKRGPAALARTIALGAVGLAIVVGALVVKHAPAPPASGDQLVKLERESLSRFGQIQIRIGDGLPMAADADEVEREVLPRWKELRDGVDAIETPDDRATAFALATERRALASRQAAFEAFIAVARAPADKQAALETAYQFAWVQADRDALATQ